MSGSDQVREAIEHLHAAQDRLNACTLIAEDVTADGRPGLLSGITVAVKDIIDQRGLPTTCGSGFYREVPAVSAPAVDRLEGEGAVIVARTNLHEFAYGFSSENNWFGPVRNPWDPATSPGGSSGGSAVAVAAGLVDGAVGTDTGGSIRVPAAMTGIFGLKVTHGRIPTNGVFPLAPSLDTVGPLARNMRTLALLYDAMAKTETGPLPGTIEGLRIVVPRMWVDGGPMEALVQSAFEATIAELRSLGAQVAELELGDILPWGKIQELAGAEAAHVHRAFRAAGQPYGPEVDARLTAAEAVTAVEYLEAQAWRARLIETVAEAFRTADVLVTPAIAQRRKVIGEDKIGDQHYRPVLSWFSALVNHSGNPAIALPLKGFESTGGPPPSLQLVAPWWQEDLLIGVGAHLEDRGVVGFIPPPIFYGDPHGR
ncbi:MAG TPA: amidase [Acidimicrobiia bacterium]|nr:amidase [Acidimicrobiia bacterium]